MRIIARFLSARPALAVGFAILVTIVLSAGFPRLEFDTRPNAIFASDNQASKNLDRLHAIFGPDDNDMLVLVEGEGLLELDALEALRKFRDQMQSIEGVKFVASIFDVNKLHAAMPLVPVYASDDFDADRLQRDLQRHPIASNQLISVDGQILTLLVRLEGESLAVSEIARVIDPLKVFAVQYETVTSAKVYLAGHPATRMDVLQTLRWALISGCTVAVAIGFVIAMLVFRHLPSVLMSIAAPVIGTAWVMGLLAWSGVAISGLMTAIPNLVFIIGLTDAVHLLLEAQRELNRGQVQRQAVYNALLRVGPACLLTSLTTFLGFGSLVFSRTDSVREFGLWAAIGTTCAMLAVVIVLPTILVIVPHSWACNDRAKRNRLGQLIKRWVAPTLIRPGITTLFAVVLCLALLYPAIRQRPDIVWTETMPYHAPSVLAMNLADKEFGGAMLASMMIRWPEGTTFPDRRTLRATADIHALFRETPGFSGPFSIRNLLSIAPGRSLQTRYQTIQAREDAKVNMLISESDRTLVVNVRVPNDGSSALGVRLQVLNEKLDRIGDKYPEYEFALTGTAVAAAENMTAIIVNLARSLAIAAGLIFVVLTIAFRSLKIGILTIVPNLLPLLVTAAGLTILGMPLQITSALTFSLCLGLAVDDTIHVLIRYRMNLEHHQDQQEAIEQTIGEVGPALIVTTTILLGGFVAMLTSPMPGLQLFACLSGVTLVTALVGDLFLFPAMLLWAGVPPQQPGRAVAKPRSKTE